jgi:hypothetical protein
MNSDDISICTTKEMEKYESLHSREFAHTHIYDANLLDVTSRNFHFEMWTIFLNKFKLSKGFHSI